VAHLEIDDMLELDIDFHVAVSRAARNAVMELAMNAIHLVRPYTNTMLVPLLRIETIASQHRAIYEAIRVGDVEAADTAFATHMAHLDEVREQALADQRPEDVRIEALSSEAHPQIERIRARVLGGASRPAISPRERDGPD
jgi:GntR family transcriptional repressor for pyruvate dehydrogenase complex